MNTDPLRSPCGAGRVSDVASNVMHSGYRNQTFAVPDTASQEGGLLLTFGRTPKPHASLWLPPNPTSVKPVTPTSLLVSKQHNQVHGLGCSNTGELDCTGKSNKNLRVLTIPLR